MMTISSSAATLTPSELEDKAHELVLVGLGLHEDDLVAVVHGGRRAFHKPRAVDMSSV